MVIGDLCVQNSAGELQLERQSDAKKVRVAVNAEGYRIGESHPRAKLTDHEIELIHQLLDDADVDKAAGRKYLRDYEIAEKFEISKSHLHNIRHDRERSQVAAKYKVLHQETK